MLDRDLQTVVNGLWAAGAEAVAVNGQRLTALSAIRSAGDAILVDYRPLTRPYVVTAIGDPATLQAAVRRGARRPALRTLQQTYGIRYVGPAASTGSRSRRRPARALRYARAKEASAVIAALGLVVGIVAGLVLHPAVPFWLQPYLPIAVVAALDAVFGAARATLDGVFDDRVFVVSFVANVLVAALIVFLGRPARRRRAALDRRRRRARDPDLLQRRRDPPPALRG